MDPEITEGREGGRVEKRPLGGKRGWRTLQDSHRSLEDKGIYPI